MIFDDWWNHCDFRFFPHSNLENLEPTLAWLRFGRLAAGVELEKATRQVMVHADPDDLGRATRQL